MARPLKTAGEALSERIVLKLSRHQTKVLDAMVQADPSHDTRQDLVRDLIKAAYVERLNRPKMDRLRMDVVPRDPDDPAPVDTAPVDTAPDTHTPDAHIEEKAE